MEENKIRRAGMVIGSFLLHVVIMGLFMSFGVLYSELHREFRVSQSRAAWIASIFNGLVGLAAVLVSYFVTRFGERKVSTVGSLILATGMLTSSLVPSFDWLYATYGCLGGFGAAMCMLPSATIIMKSFKKHRPFFLALCSSGSAFGNLILPPLLTYMITEYGWRGTFLLLSGLALQCLPSSLLFVPVIENEEMDICVVPSVDDNTPKPKSKIAESPPLTFKAATRALLKKRKYLLLCLSASLAFLVLFVPATFLPDLMKEASFSGQAIYAVLMAMGIGRLVGGIAPGLLYSFFGLDLSTMFSFTLLASAVTAGLFFIASSFAAYMALSLFLGLLSSAFLSIHDSLVASFLDKELTEVGFGWICKLEGIAIITGLPLSGRIVDATGTTKSGFLFTGGGLFVSMLLSLLLKIFK